jgi:hypothetical protein
LKFGLPAARITSFPAPSATEPSHTPSFVQPGANT